MERKISAGALLVGVLVDVGGTLVAGQIGAIIAVIVLSFAGKQAVLLDKAFASSPLLLVIETAFGLCFSGLGGYVTAVLARTEKLRHALGMGFLSVLASLAMMAFLPRQGPVWSYYVSCVLVLPFALAGGQLGAATGKTKGLVERILIAGSLLAFVYTAALIGTAFLI